MKNNRTLFLSIALLFGFLTSCHVEDNLSPQPKRRTIVYTDGVSSIEGIPIYKDWKQFYNHVNTAVSSASSLVKYEKQYSFRSLLGEYITSVYDSTYTETSDLITSSKEGPKLEAINYGFASLINKDGFAIVGAGLYKFKGSTICSIALEGINLDKAKSTLNLDNPSTQNTQVHTDYYKDLSSKQARRSTPYQEITGSANWNYGGYTTFQMAPKVGYGSSTVYSYSCPGYMVWDEDARDFVCSETVVFDGVSSYATFNVFNTITRTHCPPIWFCSTGIADPVWIQSNGASGFFSYTLNGVPNGVSFSVSSSNAYLFNQVFQTATSGTSIDFTMNTSTTTFLCYLKDDLNTPIGYFGAIIAP